MHTGNFSQGDAADTYTITINNSGGASTSGSVSLVDTLPSGLTATGFTGNGWNTDLATLTANRSDVLAPGSSYPPLLLTVSVAADAPASLTNTATVSGGGEVITGNDTASDPTTINQSADLTLPRQSCRQLQPRRFRRQLHHHGDERRRRLYERHRECGRSASDRPHGHGLHGQRLEHGSGYAHGQPQRCPSLRQQLPAAPTDGQRCRRCAASLTNTATVSGGGEVITGNDTASDPTTINQLADLTLSSSHAGNFSQGDSADSYTITVTNVGAGPTSGTVNVADLLPAGLTATGFTGNGWSTDLGTLTASRSDILAPGSSYPPLLLTVSVAVDAPASLTNTATVSGGGGEVITGNDTASDPTTINQLADLTLNSSHAGNFSQGDSADSYTITVTNVGAGSTSGTVNVADLLPTGLTATGFTGNGWSTDLGTLTASRSDVLASGSSYPPLLLTVSIAVDAPASLTNTATVSGGGEVITGNDTASDPTTINQLADLTLTSSHIGDFSQGDAADSYIITVTNVGAGPTSGTVNVADLLPAGLTATGFTGNGWSTDLGTLTASRSDVLAPGSSYPPLMLTVSVAADAPASLTNTATVSGGGEVITGNDTASDPTTINQLADLHAELQSCGRLQPGRCGRQLHHHGDERRRRLYERHRECGRPASDRPHGYGLYGYRLEHGSGHAHGQPQRCPSPRQQLPAAPADG